MLSSPAPARIDQSTSASPVALVLLHFFGSSGREWAGVSARLGSARPVMTIDLPGFGDASAMEPADVAAMAAHVDRRIAEARWSDVVLVGHSMSGKVGALLAASASDYLRGIVLVAASPPSPEPMTDDARAKLLAFDGSRAAAAAYIDGITADRLPDTEREVAIADAMRASPDAWQAWVRHGSREDCSHAVGLVALPTRVIAGARDPSLGEDIQRRLVMPHFPDATLDVIDGGHALPLENPQGLQQAIDAFLEPLETPPGGASEPTAKAHG